MDINVLSLEHAWNASISDAYLSSIVVADDILYIGDDDGIVYGINATNGTQIWNYSLAAFPIYGPRLFQAELFMLEMLTLTLQEMLRQDFTLLMQPMEAKSGIIQQGEMLILHRQFTMILFILEVMIISFML